MSSPGRSLNLDSPDYQQGVDAGNMILDTGGEVRELLNLAEIAANRAHQNEDVPGYHRMMGMIHTLREHLEGQAD